MKRTFEQKGKPGEESSHAKGSCVENSVEKGCAQRSPVTGSRVAVSHGETSCAGGAREGGLRPKNSRALVLIALHILLLVYSLSGFFSKSASREPVLSLNFILLYGGMLLILVIYALGWQQIIKRLPLTLAFANKAVTVVWGIVWGVVFFSETVTPLMVAGAVLVVAGVALFSLGDGDKEKS